MSHSVISLGLGLGGGKSATSSGRSGGGGALTAELSYPGGLWETSNYEITVAPIMHFDAAILDGADSANNPADGAALSTWGDRSGNSTNYDLTQSTASLQMYFYDSGGIQGVEEGNYLDYFNLTTSFAVASADDLTQVIIATNIDSAQNSISGLSPTPHLNANSIFVAGGNNGGLKIGGAPASSPPTFSKTDPNLHVLTKNGTAFEYWYQGGSANQSKTATVNNTFDKMFTTYTTQSNECRMHEVLVFDSEVSLANLNVIKNYANEKYSMSASNLT